MKYQSSLNLFWAIIWAVVLGCAIVAIFWQPALFAVIILSAINFGMFLREYIHIMRINKK